MDGVLLEELVLRFGADRILALAGFAVGGMFGFMAQRSQFCLRAAVIEFSTLQFGKKLAVWLLTFGFAIASVQLGIHSGVIEVAQARGLAAPGSLSGAGLGGLLFGIGMILARGCASRLLVLSATGNARALIAGLVFVVSAQASFQGILEPARLALAQIWMIEGGPSRDILARLGLGPRIGLLIAAMWIILAFIFAFRGRIGWRGWIGGAGAGLAVGAAFLVTYQVGLAELDPSGVHGITFSGPSAEILMRILSRVDRAAGFDTGLVPGVFTGAALAALAGGEWKLQVFDASTGMVRYIFGAVLMGFGAMLAGGCAVGAGISGGVVFSLTAWIALFGMWIGAGLTHRMFDHA